MRNPVPMSTKIVNAMAQWLIRTATVHCFLGTIVSMATSFQATLNVRISPLGSMIWTAQAMQGSKEWIVRRISSGWSAFASFRPR